MKNTLFIAFLFLHLSSFAQKQFNNGFSLSFGAEYFQEEEIDLLSYYSVFTQYPSYGVQLAYERKVGQFISVQAGGGLFYGRSKKDIMIRDNQGELLETTDMLNSVWRWYARTSLAFWVVQNKKHAFTPGVSFSYGSTFMYAYSIKELDRQESISTKHQYANVSLEFTNRFMLKRLRSERKGVYGELQLLATPSLLANVYKNLDWKSTFLEEPPFEPLFGVGLWLGLQYSF